ncbi:MAG: glycosyltransferase family 4 protein [Planctomycetales bacterium]|nr:glycosyltransferase family 4 protein [Planctomycetales bacterium]
MRILEVVSARDINGATRHVCSLVGQLQQRGHEVFVACLPGAWLGRQFDRRQVIETSLDRWPLDELRRIAGICRERQIDVTHTHQSRSHAFGVLLRWLHGVPTVATAHNCRIQLHWALNNHVIGVSERTTRFHRRFNLVSRRRSETVHNFIDLDDYARFGEQPAEAGGASREAVLGELGIPADRTVGAVVGKITYKKGIHIAIDALARLRERQPQLHLLMIGAPRVRDLEYRDQVVAQAERLGVADRVTWAGECRDVLRLLRATELMISASLEENFPISLLEAMALGLPVVATRVGGVPECVVDGVTGSLATAGSADSLAAAIDSQSPELRLQMGTAGAERVRLHFSAESQLPKIERVLAAAVGSAGRRKRELWPWSRAVSTGSECAEALGNPPLKNT